VTKVALACTVISNATRKIRGAILWPWQDRMTIGIGALATSDEGRKNKLTPDTAILIADTMGSYEDIDSHARLHKILMFPEDRVYAAAAGDVTLAAEMIPGICSLLREIPRGERTYGKIQQALANGCFEYKSHKFTLFELPRHRLAPHAFNPNQKLDADLDVKIQAAWSEFNVGCDALVVVFDDMGTAFLFELLGQEHTIFTRNFPGFAAIGTGSGNALFWLARRQHTLGLLPLRAAYHAYEAKLTAEGSAHVNEHIDILVATANEHWFCTTHKSLHGEKEHPEINLLSLQRLLKKYWVKKTDDIGVVIKPLPSRKSAGRL